MILKRALYYVVAAVALAATAVVCVVFLAMALHAGLKPMVGEAWAGVLVAAAAALITSAATAISKASLDASLQHDLPEASRASAFGRSESVLQLAWVIGGAVGVLIYTDLWVGFTAVSALLIPGLAQTLVSYNGGSLIPGFGGNRPVLAEQEGPVRREDLVQLPAHRPRRVVPRVDRIPLDGRGIRRPRLSLRSHDRAGLHVLPPLR